MSPRRPAPSPGWTPPERVDEYRLVRLIGRGGMGQVYLAEDTLLARRVAVKFIASLRPDDTARQRFQIEARAIARLSHPNVVSVHRVGEVEKRPYLVAEFVQGRSLAELAKPVPWEHALRIGLGLARGMAAAHRQGVLHRDIKPANVMLTEEGGIKLLDFGLAKLLGSAASVPASEDSAPSTEGTASELSGAGGMLGTPLYMAPEVLRGGPATRASDIYSLGAVLYELCTGAAPRQAASEVVSFEEWVELEPTPLRQRVPNMEPRLAAVISRCLLRQPEHRFDSAEELCSALEEAEPERASGELPEGNPYRGLQPFEAEHRALFFGRNTEAQTIIERLRSEPLIIVTGDSGVGKSSLCRAGVLPRVAEGALADGRDYRLVGLVPGRYPFTALSAALANAWGLSEEQLSAELLEGHPWELGRKLRQAQGRNTGALLFVDQLEELFTLSLPEEASRFSRALSRLGASSAGVRILLAVRGDFFTRLGSLPGFEEEISRALYLLRPLSPEGIRAAITQPARRKGVHFESEQLVTTLVESTMKAAGGLPLLQFALAELWEARDEARHQLTASALDSMGGVSGALARHADGVLTGMVPEQRQSARRLLLRLVTAEGTRARRTGVELDASAPAAQAALEALVRGRLLVARELDGERAYEVAHEALLQEWGTLRQWLETDGERRQVRERVEAAATEWARLGRTQDALYSARQLAEVREMESSEFSPRGAGFLRASEAHVRRVRYAKLGLLMAVPLMLGLLLGGGALMSRLNTAEQVKKRSAEADTAMEEGRGWKARADELRRQAYSCFDAAGEKALQGSAPCAQGAESQWTEALRAFRQADAALALADRALDAALALEPSAAPIRFRIGEVLADRIELMEWFHQKERHRDMVERLKLYGSDERKRWLTLSPRLSMTTSPPGAHVLVERYTEDAEGQRKLVPEPSPGWTPLLNAELKNGPGSYLLTFIAPGRAEVRYPILLSRGEQRTLHVNLPREEAVPEGYVYIPEGRFLFGSADPERMRRGIMKAQPLHEVRTGAFLISKKEVTFGEWIQFLNALPQAEREPRIPWADLRQWKLKLDPLDGQQWQLSLWMNGKKLVARQGQPLEFTGRKLRMAQDWSQMPVAGITVKDAEAYLAWLAKTGRVPHARLCREHEWERAARGADDRLYPHGDWLQPDDANFDETYGRQSDAFGPDEVGSHPESTSPFGLFDMAGNGYELTKSVTASEAAVIRGGSWYYDGVSVLIANRTVVETETRGIDNGLRVCADAPLE